MSDTHRVESWIEVVRHEHKEERMNRTVPAPFESRYLNCEILPHGEGLPLPFHQTEGSSGADLYAAVPEDAPLVLEPGKMAMVPTGIKVQIFPGFEGQARSRSGLAVKHNVTVFHGVGTIDNDYTGELFFPLFNHGDKPFTINRGERIGQLIISPYQPVVYKRVDKLNDTVRGEGGFGHTG